MILYKIDNDVVFYKTGLDFTLLREQLEGGAVKGYDMNGQELVPYDALTWLSKYSNRKIYTTEQDQIQSNMLVAPDIIALIRSDMKSLGASTAQKYFAALSNTIPLLSQGQFEMAALSLGVVNNNAFFTSERIAEYQAIIRSADAVPYTPLDYKPVPVASLGYAGEGVSQAYAAGYTGYLQHILQNTLKNPIASADLVVNNDISTDTNYYGDLGINSSGFTGPGSLSLPNATYLVANSGDLVIGTNTANNIRFVVNDNSTDVLFIDSQGARADFNAHVSSTELSVSGPIHDSLGDTGLPGQWLLKNSSGQQVWSSTGAGITGAPGITGSAGTVGSQGITGVRGLTGANGAAGAQGATGTNGVAGSQGTTGANGVVGSQGSTGLAGVQGLTGFVGLTGTVGITGTPGITGRQGLTGFAGVQGITGAAGVGGGSSAGTIGIVIDNGSTSITTGIKTATVVVPFSCTITGWTVLSKSTGSASISLLKGTYATFPLSSGNNICGSAYISLSSAQKNASTTGWDTGWTKVLAAGDILGVEVLSASVTNLSIQVSILKG